MVSNRDIKKQDVNSNRRICQICGKKNSLKAEFCIECGKKLPKVIIPFSDTIPLLDKKIKAENEKSTSNSAINDTKLVESSKKKEIQKNKKVSIVKDSSLKDTKKPNFDPNKQICQNCGNKSPSNAKFCVTCGNKLSKFLIPFSDTHSSEDDKIKAENEKTTPHSATIDNNVKSSEKEKYSDVKDIKKREIDPNKRICQNCGNKNPFNAKFCVTCGKELPKITTPLADINSNGDNNRKDSKKAIKGEDLSLEGETSPLDAIKMANELLQIGAITEEEFETIKAKYIEKI